MIILQRPAVYRNTLPDYTRYRPLAVAVCAEDILQRDCKTWNPTDGEKYPEFCEGEVIEGRTKMTSRCWRHEHAFETARRIVGIQRMRKARRSH